MFNTRVISIRYVNLHKLISKLNMGKIDKKRLKIKDRIKQLESEMVLSLTKKTSDTSEISVGDYQRKIIELNKELQLLK